MTDPLDIFIGKPKIYGDPLSVLMRLLKLENGSKEGPFHHAELHGECMFCGYGQRNYREHAADCPYVEAIILFGDPNSDNRPQGTLKA